MPPCFCTGQKKRISGTATGCLVERDRRGTPQSVAKRKRIFSRGTEQTSHGKTKFASRPPPYKENFLLGNSHRQRGIAPMPAACLCPSSGRKANPAILLFFVEPEANRRFLFSLHPVLLGNIQEDSFFRSPPILQGMVPIQEIGNHRFFCSGSL